MKSSVLIVCHRCGHERDITRAEVVTSRWKRAACPACGYVHDPPSPVTATCDDHGPEAAWMPRTCTVCSHPDRPAIDAALVAGDAYRNIESISDWLIDGICGTRAGRRPA